MKQTEILGVKETVAYYISNLIGAGILVVPAIAYSISGIHVLAVWFLLIIASWPLAKIFSMISTRYPHNSGILNFLHIKASKNISQFADDVTIFVMLVGNPILGFVASRYTLSALGFYNEVLFYILAAFFMAFSVIFNMLGLRNSSRLQSILTFITLFILLTLAGASIWWNSNHIESLIPSGSSVTGIVNVESFLQALGICFFVFVGWENVAAIAPNIKNRKYTFNTSILIAVPIIGACYLFIAFALALSATQEDAQTNFAVLDLMTASFGSGYLSILVSIFSIVVVVVSCNAWVLAASKVLNGLSSSGRLPSFLSKGSGETPHIALIVLLIFYMLVVFLSYVFGNQEDLIIRYVSAGFIAIYVITLWYFFKLNNHNNERIMCLVGLLLTLIAASGLYLEITLLSLAGFFIGFIRMLRSK